MERKISLLNIRMIKQLRNTDLAPTLNMSGAVTLLAFIHLHVDRDILILYNITQLCQYYCWDTLFVNVSSMHINLYSLSFHTFASSRISWYTRILPTSSRKVAGNGKTNHSSYTPRRRNM